MKDSEIAAAAALGLLILSQRSSVDVPVPIGPRKPTRAELAIEAGAQWPLPTIQVRGGRAYQAVISDGYQYPRENHDGVDIMYRRETARSSIKRAYLYDLSRFRGTWDSKHYMDAPQGTELFFCPLITPVRPLADGRVWHASRSARGFQVVVDHGTFSTYYQHMSVLSVPLCAGGFVLGSTKKHLVTKDSPLGLVGQDPSGGPVHLHFEVWGYRINAETKRLVKYTADPAPVLAAASRWGIEMPP